MAPSRPRRTTNARDAIPFREYNDPATPQSPQRALRSPTVKRLPTAVKERLSNRSGAISTRLVAGSLPRKPGRD
jgi:hypothetical protein